MARILALDFGKVRTGVAVTDELQLIASGLATVETKELLEFLKNYFEAEKVEKIVIGEPKQMSGEVSESEALIAPFIINFKKHFPNLPVVRQDERFTSKMALDSMIAGGMKKKKRQNKGELDKISATIILQSYLERK
ncbi:putative pre-16S rRNA nuclease [Croceivirga lutea]|uniref:Holliday junction resolvase RuvX n=1 Tax=Croceivirga lutea TaxID=1775167 RepID=UPI0016396242|nr:Holliday junction resolvase RuvX [Croceivirga lutea]GGG49526.1 putative pre-16S rRNA nuclease [Croceivirga lutea]